MKLLPFNSVEECPKCGLSVRGYLVAYSTTAKIEVGDGRHGIEPTADELELAMSLVLRAIGVNVTIQVEP